MNQNHKLFVSRQQLQLWKIHAKVICVTRYLELKPHPPHEHQPHKPHERRPHKPHERRPHRLLGLSGRVGCP